MTVCVVGDECLGGGSGGGGPGRMGGPDVGDIRFPAKFPGIELQPILQAREAGIAVDAPQVKGVSSGQVVRPVSGAESPQPGLDGGIHDGLGDVFGQAVRDGEVADRPADQRFQFVFGGDDLSVDVPRLADDAEIGVIAGVQSDLDAAIGPFAELCRGVDREGSAGPDVVGKGALPEDMAGGDEIDGGDGVPGQQRQGEIAVFGVPVVEREGHADAGGVVFAYPPLHLVQSDQVEVAATVVDVPGEVSSRNRPAVGAGVGHAVIEQHAQGGFAAGDHAAEPPTPMRGQGGVAAAEDGLAEGHHRGCARDVA